MPRFFFDVHDGRDFFDNEGIECEDLTSARREAIRASGAILSEKDELGIGEIWSMLVRDEQGAIVAKLEFFAR